MMDPHDMNRLFQGADPNDTRFQFKVIEGLAESIRQMTGQMVKMQEAQVDMLVRLARIEENKVGEVVAKLDEKVEGACLRLNALETDKDRRDGALGMLGILRVWGPLVFSALAALWLYGRSAGVVPAPPVAPTRVEAVVHPEERRIEGIVGGKP